MIESTQAKVTAAEQIEQRTSRAKTGKSRKSALEAADRKMELVCLNGKIK